MAAISQDRQRCQFLFFLMKNPLLYRSAWPESSREASERFLMETLGRNSEQAAPSALAGGFRLLRSSGIARLDAPAHAAGAGRHGQMHEDFDNHHGPSGDVANRSYFPPPVQKLRLTSKAGRAGRRLSVRLKPFGLHNLHDNWIAQVLEQRPGGLRLPGVRTDARGEV